jgi:hypothetical protein
MTIYKKRIYKQISNIYATLPAFAADPPDNETTAQHPSTNLHQNNVYTSTFRAKALRRVAARRAKANAKLEEELVLDKAITWAEDEHTALAKLDTALPRRTAIERGHTITKATTPSILQTSKNWGYALQSTIKDWARTVSKNHSHVRFAKIRSKRHTHHGVARFWGGQSLHQ